MSSNRNILYFFRNLTRKQRLSLRREHNDREVWYMHISPIEIVGGFLAMALIIFIIILTLVAYTPILNLIPGYSGNKSREQMIQSIVKVDSIEQRLNELQVYYSNVSLIMDGKTPITRNVQQAGDSLRASAAETIAPSREDSILRAQLEGNGVYGLENVVAARKPIRPGVELMSPVRGIVSSRFSPRDGSYGVTIATSAGQQVLSIDEGSVILSAWTAEDGYVVQIQHADNLVSTYKMSSQPIVTTGARVYTGEVIGYTGEVQNESLSGQFGFELWQNGTAVDPENYIIF